MAEVKHPALTNGIPDSNIMYIGPNMMETTAEIHHLYTPPRRQTPMSDTIPKIPIPRGFAKKTPAAGHIQHDPESRPDSGLDTDYVSDSSLRNPLVRHPHVKHPPSTSIQVDVQSAAGESPISPSLSVNNIAKVDEKLPAYLEASQQSSRIIVVIKWLVVILMFVVFLGCIVFSKLSIIHMTTVLRTWDNHTTHDTTSGVGEESVYLMIILTIMIPYAMTLVRSVWCGAFRSDRPWPSRQALAWGVLSSVAESAGISLFTLDVLPHSPSYIGLLLMNGVFLFPIICQLYFSARRHKRGLVSESRRATIVLGIALAFCLSGIVLTAYFEIGFRGFSDHKLWEIPLSILLLSFAWCPLIQNKQLVPSRNALAKLVNADKKPMTYSEEAKLKKDAAELHGTSSTTPTPSVASSVSSASGTSGTSGDSVLTDPDDPGNVRSARNRDTRELSITRDHPQFSARWKISIITSFLKLLFIPAFAVLYAYVFQLASIPNLLIGLNHISTSHPTFTCFMISVFTSFGGYMVGWGACVMGIHKAAFTAPLILSTPLAVALIVIPQSCDIIFHHLQIDCSLPLTHRPEITIPAACLLYISQLLSVGFFLFKTVTIVMPKESQIFWLPGYNSIFLEQHLLLSRKNKQTDAAHEDPSTKAQKTRVYICTTMFRESSREMEQLLKSYSRVNKAKQWSDRNFQAHIFLDNGVRGSRLTPFALQLVSIMKKTLGVAIQTCTKVATPYGMSLAWLLPSEVKNKQGMYLTVHLKDNIKVKNKKRWSQIMYMSYVLDYAIREYENSTDEDSFILTTDADIQFAPGSVEALLDLMTRDPTVGAVCSRTHPMGSGPMYWYQIFDYAIGHWLQKAANHVLGSVLCCPGCFSVFRVAALRDVIPTYASSVTHASEFLTKDMGEDRWLCTLMVQAGWRLDYCAAAENSTYVPEEFEEYFKQRRRWIPSSLANQVLLMQEWITIYYFNKQIPLAFILYQGILLVSSLLNPSVSIVIIVGGLYYAWNVPQTISIIIMLTITCGYTWICISTSQDMQLKIAKFLTIVFSMVMAVVVIGTVVKLKHEVSPEPESTTVVPTTTTTTTTHRPHTTTTNASIYEPFNMDDMTIYQNPDIPNVWMQPPDAIDARIPPSMKYYHGNTRSTEGINALGKNSTVVPPSDSTTESPHEPTIFPTTSIYFFGIVAIFLVTGLMHLNEVYCLLHGLWYLLALPAGNLILMIYSICNMTDRSWAHDGVDAPCNRTARAEHAEGRRSSSPTIHSLVNGTREEKKAVGFGDVGDWQESLKVIVKKIFFCCDKKSDKQPLPGLDSPKDKGKSDKSSNLRVHSRGREEDIGQQGGDHDDDDDDDDDPQWRTNSGIERKQSFRFHYDETDSGPKPVKDWLPSNFRPMYAPLFVKKGYDDTTFLSGLTDADVAAVGIKSKAHISALMSAIRLLPEHEIEPCVPENAEEWLKHIGLQIYRLNFRRSHIVTRNHLEILRSMSKQDIEKELCITKPGHLRRLKIAIENLRYPTAVEEEQQLVKYEIEALPLYNLKAHGPREYDFWEALRKQCLLPDSVAFAHDLDLKEKLTELRNAVLLLYAVSNALWLILITTLVKQPELSVLGTTALDLGFLVVFGAVLVIQFLCMIVHRASTWMHVIARAPFRCGDPSNSSWSWGELTKSVIQKQSRTDPEANPSSLEDSVEASAMMQKRHTNALIQEGYRKKVSDLRNGTRLLSVVAENDDDGDGDRLPLLS